MSTTAPGERPHPSEAEEARAAGDAQLGAVFAAGAGMLAALRKIATAVLALLVAEAQVLRASVALVIVGGIALVAFAVSLWACVVALIGWGVAVLTGSVGIALGVLVVLHCILIAAIWTWIRLAIRRASFPMLRAELRVLGRELRRDVARFQNAGPAPPAPPGPERAP